jgi:hypothetical protein
MPQLFVRSPGGDNPDAGGNCPDMGGALDVPTSLRY